MEKDKKDEITVSEYSRIRQEISEYLDEKKFKKIPSSFDKLPDNHQQVVTDYANLIYEKAKILEPSISRDLNELISDGNAYFTSFEHRLKTLHSLKRKIIADSKDYNGSYYRASHNICDSIRYTLLIEDNSYVVVVNDYLHNLEEMGYEVIDFKNNWGDEFYQGINVRIVAKNKEDIFEIQFHTPFGYEIKEKCTRDLYEVIRDPYSSASLKIDANKLRKLFQKQVVPPPGVLDYQFESLDKRR